MNEKIKKILITVFSFDLRSLALLRISLATTILVDLILRSRDLAAHYTDQGILTRDLLLENLHYPWEWTFHALGGDVYFETALFIISGVFALSLLFGYKTRIATILCWIFLVSLQNRNSYILFGADRVLVLSLFWSIFLPLGKKFSLDSLIKKNQIKETAVISAATIAYLIQIFIIYFFNFLSKNSPEWQQGTAVYTTLNTIIYTTPFGEFLSHYPLLNKLLSKVTLGVEGIVPFILFLPIWNPLGRLIIFILLSVMHIGFGLNISLGIFTLASITLLTPLLPKEFWELLIEVYHKKSLLLNKKWIKLFAKPFPKNQLEQTWKLNIFVSFFVVCCLVYVIFWNLANIKGFTYLMPRELRPVGYVLHLEQQWNFFSSFPPKIFGWYVIVGELNNGKKINLLNSEKVVNFERPQLGTPYYQNNRWGVYFVHLTNANDRSVFIPLASYYCKNWNKNKSLPDSLTQVEVFFLQQRILPDLGIYEPLLKNSLFKVSCS